LKGQQLKSGSGCPDPRGPSKEEMGLAMPEKISTRENGDNAPEL
jgi:hypothetical protein